MTTRQGVRRAGDRSHQGQPRRLRVNLRFDDDELADIAVAAAAAGMTPTGFCADAALAAARDTPPASLDVEREALAELQVELFAARVAVNRIGTNLNQGIAALNATGKGPEWLKRAAALCERRLHQLDEVISRVDRRLR